MFLSSFLLSMLLVIIKLAIPAQYQFINPISIYGTLLSSVIFIYWFILAPAIAEYKESEKLLTDIKTSLENLKQDTLYFALLKDTFDAKGMFLNLSHAIVAFFDSIADHKDHEYLDDLHACDSILLVWEKAWIPANHIIRFKQELSIVKKSFLRVSEIKQKDALPQIIHQLKNFITFMVIITLLFLDIDIDASDILGKLQESLMLFLISFLYIYLSLIINGLDNPFDKRRFRGYLDLGFLLEFSKNLAQEK